MVDVLEWIGTLFSLAGAFLLATNTKMSKYGWIAFVVANLALIAFSVGIERYGLLLQQLGFMGTSLLGLYRSGLLSLPAPTP